jgi:hypothetical protein
VRLRPRLHLLAGFVAVLLASCRDAARPRPPVEGERAGEGHRHVLLLHLDGFRPDLTKALLESGRLPYLAYLQSRGRVSFEATTVDKSETMKVIQSYLTSELDTSVVGWWQFDRSDFRFRNFWLDPAEVVSYALGLTFPGDPTVLDFLAARGENLVSGMGLARRGVPFENYGRVYLEGIRAVGAHTYHRQADATIQAFLDIHRRIAERNERSPAISTLVLAAADEFSHAEGVEAASDEAEHCFEREREPDDTLFRLLEEDPTRGDGGALASLESSYFTRVRRSPLGGKVEEVCVALPLLAPEDSRPPSRAHPHYVLSMIVLDIEIGYLIDGFRAIRFDADGTRRIERQPSLRETHEEREDSLFDRTLFLVFGDHGMVDTPLGMTGDRSFVLQLDRALALTSGEGGAEVPAGVELGIDDEHLPDRLVHPELHREWQSVETRRVTEESDGWARRFLKDLKELARGDLHENYWWLFFLRSLLVDPKLDEAMASVNDEATSVLRGLYLRGVPRYRASEREANRDFFDRNVRLVYGGGARNNAELFLPHCEENGHCAWDRRPSYREIVSYRGGKNSETTLLEALRANEGVGFLFVRKNNELFSDGGPLPAQTEIEVQDRWGNRATIGVRRAPRTGELVFHYRTDPGSPRDPIGYARFGAGEGTSGTYLEWNDRTLREGYVNVVGGIGAYLYSTHPAIGDVLAMHATGWNFGDNLGGHGGVHRYEKTTFLLASGPGIEPGELFAEGGETGSRHAPTLLDLTPTALAWLGYTSEDLERFARDGFPQYLDAWIRTQRGTILSHLDGMDALERAKAEQNLEGLSLKPLLPEIERLLAFVDVDREETLKRLEPRPVQGHRLELRQERR